MHMGSYPIYHDEQKAKQDLQTQIDVLRAKLADQQKEANAPVKADFRGKTNLKYALEQIEVRWNAREVFAKRAARKVAQYILGRGMAQFWQLNDCKLARDLLQLEQVAETHMALALEYVAVMVESE